MLHNAAYDARIQQVIINTVGLLHGMAITCKHSSGAYRQSQTTREEVLQATSPPHEERVSAVMGVPSAHPKAVKQASFSTSDKEATIMTRHFYT